MNYKFEFKLFINILDDVVNAIIDNKDIIEEYYYWIHKSEIVSVSINSEYVHFKLYDGNGQHFSDAKPLEDIHYLIGYEYDERK